MRCFHSIPHKEEKNKDSLPVFPSIFAGFFISQRRERAGAAAVSLKVHMLYFIGVHEFHFQGGLYHRVIVVFDLFIIRAGYLEGFAIRLLLDVL